MIKSYYGKHVPFQPKLEWDWMLEDNTPCHFSVSEVKCTGDCTNCIYAWYDAGEQGKRAKFYYTIFNKENKTMCEMPELKNFDIVELDNNEISKYALVNKDAKSIIYIDATDGNLHGFDWFDEGKPQDKLKHIIRIWRPGPRFNGSMLRDIIHDLEKYEDKTSYHHCIWSKPEAAREVTMEELNKLLKDNGLPPVKIKE